MSGAVNQAAGRPQSQVASNPAPAGRRWFAVPWLDVVIVVGLLMVVALQTPAITDPGGDYSPPLIEPGWGWRAEWWAWVLQLALVVPLLWRRRAPLAVFAVCAGAAFVQWLAGPELYGNFAVLIAHYTVVAYEPRGRAVSIAGGVALLGLALAVQRWALPTTAAAAATISLAAMVAIPVALGLVTRNRLRLLSATREEAAQAERARIAREMHDVVTHNLSVMVALSDGARLSLDRDPAGAADAIAQIGRTGREGLAEMRRLLGVLADPSDDAAPLRPQPSINDLEAVADTVRAAGLEVQLVVDPAAASISPALSLAVHRIAQEALTNVLKHAPAARRVHVSIDRPGDSVRVQVQDDGGNVSAKTPPGTPQTGHGLAGMTERARLHGGALTAGPHAGGWRVEATLPLDQPKGQR